MIQCATLLIGGDDALTARLARALAARGPCACVTARSVDDGLGVRAVDEAAADVVGAQARTLVYVAAARGAGFGVPDAADLVAVLDAATGVDHLVVVGSALVFDPHHQHPGMAGELLRTARGPGHPLARAWQQLEDDLRGHPLAQTIGWTLLRPAPVVPAPASADAAVGDPVDGAAARDPRRWPDAVGRLFLRRRVPTVWGYDPTVQLLDAEALTQAVVEAVAARPTGVWHVAPTANAPLAAAVRLAGRRRLALPYSLHRRLARLTCDGQPDGVAYLRHAVTIDGAAWRVRAEIRAAGDHSAPPTSAASARALAPGAGAVDAAALPRFDDYDLDPAYVARLDRLFLRAMHDRWWRIEVRGLEHVPRDGRGVLTGVHRGFQPWDGVMMLRLCAERLMRHPRFLVHPSLVKMPWLAPYMRKLGGIIACRENAARVLEADDLLAIFPEGISGAFRPYRDAYRLTRFGRDEYLKMALRHRAPIVPFVTVGSAEIFPIVAKVQWRWWTRTMEWPCLPIAPPFPLLPVPLPSKWHTVFLPPIHVERRYGPDAADDAALVRALSRRIQMRMQAALDDLRARRPGIFRGRIWADPEAPTLSPAVLASTPVLERDAEAA